MLVGWTFNISRLLFFSVCFVFVSQPDCFQFSPETILKLISECKELIYIGDLATWSISEGKVERIRDSLRNKNLDVTIVYRNDCKPDITMQSIRGE